MEPSWLGIARKYIGIREIPGPKHNATIMGWLSRAFALVRTLRVQRSTFADAHGYAE